MRNVVSDDVGPLVSPSEELKYLDFARIDFEMSKIQVSIFRYSSRSISSGFMWTPNQSGLISKIFLLIGGPNRNRSGPANILSAGQASCRFRFLLISNLDPLAIRTRGSSFLIRRLSPDSTLCGAIHHCGKLLRYRLEWLFYTADPVADFASFGTSLSVSFDSILRFSP